jgi:hypothetical protein
VLHAQGFNSGSDGSDGDLNVTQNTTLDVPPDGIFNFRTVTIGGVSLTFRRNALNTPVFMLATGDIRVQGNIILDGSAGTSNPPAGGAGGAGGFDGGDPGIQSVAPGAGHGPGGGAGGDPGVVGTANTSAGAAAYGSVPQQPSTSDGAVYGSPLLVPMAGGSGGGGASGQANGTAGIGGSGGGGAILLASNTLVDIPGGIFARGGSNNFPHTGQGSGGAIRIVAPRVAGSGSLVVTGGSGGVNGSNGDQGGQGRIRIDTIDRTGIRFSFQPQPAFSIGAFMAVFPPVVPRLDIVEAAGRAIAEGSGPVEVLLPFGSTTSQTVKVQARNFTGSVSIEVVLVPASGPRTVKQTQINMSTNPAQVTVNVEIPVNNSTRVEAWTR